MLTADQLTKSAWNIHSKARKLAKAYNQNIPDNSTFYIYK